MSKTKSEITVVFFTLRDTKLHSHAMAVVGLRKENKLFLITVFLS
jgi:hypothetical protein